MSVAKAEAGNVKKLSQLLKKEKEHYTQYYKNQIRLETKTVLHDVISPLNSAVLQIETLKEKLEGGESDHIFENLMLLEQSIKKILSFATNNVNPKQNVSVSYEIARTVSGMTSDFIEADAMVTTHFDRHVTFLGYRETFRRVLENIIKNSLEAFADQKTSKEKLISIKTYCRKLKVFVEISDNGPGIPENLMRELFNPGVTTKAKKSNSGFGLYVVKKLVEEELDGTIEVESSKNGAAFTLGFDISSN